MSDQSNEVQLDDQFSQPQSEAPQGNSSMDADGPPTMGRPVTPTFEPLAPPPPQRPSKVLIGIAGAALILVAFGIVRSIIAEPEPEKPKRAAQPSIWSQQQQIARDAIDMARQAQQMQRDHMEHMRRAMEDDYGYMEDGVTGFETP